MENENRVTYYSQMFQNQPEIISTEDTNTGIDVDVTTENTTHNGFKETKEIHVSRRRWILATGVASTITLLFLVLVIYLSVISSGKADYTTQNKGACASCPCKNGAKCRNLNGNYTCSCLSGYNGYNCETEIDECLTSPCINGGTCLDKVNSYICLCPRGYEGQTCERDINECLSGPCQNGGRCIDRVNSYTCSCQEKFTGKNCEIVTCSTGWRKYKLQCFFYGKDSKTWDEAQAYCEANNSMLVEIHDKDIDNFLKKELLTLAGGYHDFNYFTGGTYAESYGDWKWAGSNRLLTFKDWGKNQPGYGEHCIALDRSDSFRFHDYPCNHNLGFICETNL